MSTSPARWLCTSLVIVTACGRLAFDAEVQPHSAVPDASAPRNDAADGAAHADAAAFDAFPRDGATIDAWTGDAGVDASPSDAAARDAPSPADAASLDAHLPDAALTDAALTDAGPSDASLTDTGSATSDTGPATCTAERCNGLDDDCDSISDEAVCPTGCTPSRRTTDALVSCAIGASAAGARNACNAMGGELARVDDAAENALILARGGSDDVWIDGNDVATEDRWEYSDGTLFYRRGTSFAYTNWGGDEPTNENGNEDCVVILARRLNELNPGDWNDTNCNNSNSYACEVQ